MPAPTTKSWPPLPTRPKRYRRYRSRKTTMDPGYFAPRRRWLGGAIAAGLALAIVLGVWQVRGGTYAIETAPGEVRLVELEGVDHIELAGASRIVLDRRDPRKASLDHGQALFTIDHDPAAPFTLTVGEDTLVDVGTIFDVKHTSDGMALAVSAGAVVFNPAPERPCIAGPAADQRDWFGPVPANGRAGGRGR